MCDYKDEFYKCGRKNYKNYNLCFWHIDDKNKFTTPFADEFLKEHNSSAFGDIIRKEINSGLSFGGTCLRGLRLQCIDFSNANFIKADLRDVHFGYGTLKGSFLVYSNLTGASLSDVNIEGVNFNGAKMYNVKFCRNSFNGVIGITKDSFFGLDHGLLPTYRIYENKKSSLVLRDCFETYTKLSSYFYQLGLIDDSSWAFYKAKSIQRLIFRDKANIFISDPIEHKITLIERIFYFHRYLVSLFNYFIIGYGEKPQRVIFWSLFIILFYTFLYSLLGVSIDNNGNVLNDLLSSLYFSIVTFTTLGYGDIHPIKKYSLLAASEAIIGVVMIGLFLFTISRRSVGRG